MAKKLTVREELTQRRISLGMTRLELAGKIGVREVTLFRWERGGIVTIPARSLADWERALDQAEEERRAS